MAFPTPRRPGKSHPLAPPLSPLHTVRDSLSGSTGTQEPVEPRGRHPGLDQPIEHPGERVERAQEHPKQSQRGEHFAGSQRASRRNERPKREERDNDRSGRPKDHADGIQVLALGQQTHLHLAGDGDPVQKHRLPAHVPDESQRRERGRDGRETRVLGRHHGVRKSTDLGRHPPIERNEENGKRQTRTRSRAQLKVQQHQGAHNLKGERPRRVKRRTHVHHPRPIRGNVVVERSRVQLSLRWTENGARNLRRDRRLDLECQRVEPKRVVDVQPGSHSQREPQRDGGQKPTRPRARVPRHHRPARTRAIRTLNLPHNHIEEERRRKRQHIRPKLEQPKRKVHPPVSSQHPAQQRPIPTRVRLTPSLSL